MHRRFLILFGLLLQLSLSASCARNPNALPDALMRLGSSNPDTRREAAETLRELTDEHPLPEAVAPLLAAASRESKLETFGALLIALGSTGDPVARVLILRYTESENEGLRDAAVDALRLWQARQRTLISAH